MSSSDLNSNTVTQHPLQDVDLNATPLASSHMPFEGNENVVSHADNATTETTKNVKKENWVKFDDDVNEGILGTSSPPPMNINNNNIAAINDHHHHMNASNTGAVSTSAPTPANRLAPSPLPPPTTAKRNSSVAVAAAGSSARPRTPTMDSGVQQLQAVELNAALMAATSLPPSQPAAQRSSAASIPDVAAPAVLTTESTHVDLNASGRVLAHQQQQQQQQQQHHNHHHQITNNQQQQHHQKSSTTTAGRSSNNIVGTSSNNLHQQQQQQQHQHQHQHHQQHLPHHSNHVVSSTKLPPMASTTAAGSAMASGGGVATTIPIESQPQMRTIELSTGRIREGFANGDVIVTLLPANTKFPWVTPAIFRPELVPEELMAQGLTLTVEEYVHAMETLVNDYRFTMYNICYKRILVLWILFAFTVLLTLLFSGLQGVALFSLGVSWLFLNAAAIFFCMWIKLRLARGLEKCLARVNKQLIKHKILLILDDRGRISCHKVNLCFLYFDSAPCVTYLNEFLEHTEQNGGEAVKAGWEAKLDIDMNDIVIQGPNPVRVSRKQEQALQVFLRYASRWGREAIRGLVDVTPLEPGRHCGQFQCPCQYIKDHLQCKPRGYPCSCVAYASDPHVQYRY